MCFPPADSFLWVFFFFKRRDVRPSSPAAADLLADPTHAKQMVNLRQRDTMLHPAQSINPYHQAAPTPKTESADVPPIEREKGAMDGEKGKQGLYEEEEIRRRAGKRMEEDGVNNDANTTAVKRSSAAPSSDLQQRSKAFLPQLVNHDAL